MRFSMIISGQKVNGWKNTRMAKLEWPNAKNEWPKFSKTVKNGKIQNGEWPNSKIGHLFILAIRWSGPSF